MANTVVPSKNWTLPVGLPDPFTTGVTVAVNVTFMSVCRRIGARGQRGGRRHGPGEGLIGAGSLAVAGSDRAAYAGEPLIVPLIRPELVLIDRPHGKPLAE